MSPVFFPCESAWFEPGNRVITLISFSFGEVLRNNTIQYVKFIIFAYVSDPPEVTAERVWVHAGEGEEVTLVCKVYANPSPRVSWYKSTMKLIEGEWTHIQAQRMIDWSCKTISDDC